MVVIINRYHQIIGVAENEELAWKYLDKKYGKMNEWFDGDHYQKCNHDAFFIQKVERIEEEKVNGATYKKDFGWYFKAN